MTVWTSTQVPYAARGGIADTLQIPESHVRVIVPLLGGGFGAKCDFHFEGHVAALARAARRPVKLVFSRREEFVAVGHRREGMVIELETGARADGTLVARKARLVLDKGAYCGEGGFFAQMAAMHALGPYELENVHVESSLVYSNNQPSSSIRAPTAPQVCWALEQHMDELAAALEIDPVDLRRKTLIEEGSVTATGQVLEQIAMKETLEKAVELIGYGQELPDDEAIGVSVGWWPCFASPSGAYVKLNPDGTGTIITGAQENGTGAVMAMPKYVAEQLGMQPEDFSLLYQDTDAAPSDMGSCGSQTTFNSGRAVIAAAVDLREQLLDAAAEELEAAREDLELRDGAVLVKGSPDKSITIAKLAGGGTFHGKGAGEVPDGPEAHPAEGCVGRLGLESFHAPQLMAHAVRVRVDRGTGVVRVLEVAAAHDCGTILNKIGADGQVYGGVVMGIGQALSEGTQIDADGPPAQPAPHRLQARDRVRRAAHRHRLDRDRHPERRPEGLEGRRRAAVRPDRRCGGERDREGDRRAGAQAADDAGAGLGGRSVSVTSFSTATSVDDALAALAAGARPSPAAPTSSSAPAPASRRCPRASSRSTAWSSSRASRRSRTVASGSARSPRHAEIAAQRGCSRPLLRARRCLRDRRLPRDTRAGHARRQPHERLARDGDGRPTRVPRIDGDAPVGLGAARCPRRGSLDRPRRDGRARRRAARRHPCSGALARHGQRLPPARVPAADGDRRRRRDGRRHRRGRHA